MDFGQSLTGRAVVNRAFVSALRASIPIAGLAVAGCGDEAALEWHQLPEDPVVTEYVLNRCLTAARGPTRTTYNDWDEAIEECRITASRIARYCPDGAKCYPGSVSHAQVLAVLPAKAIEAGTAKTERLGPTDESAVGKADLPNNSGL